jgi:hypothetical protein
MGSAQRDRSRFEYRNHVYELWVGERLHVNVEVFEMGTDRELASDFFNFRSPTKAVRRAHAYARDYIDRRMRVLNAVEDVGPSTCRGLGDRGR